MFKSTATSGTPSVSFARMESSSNDSASSESSSLSEQLSRGEAVLKNNLKLPADVKAFFGPDGHIYVKLTTRQHFLKALGRNYQKTRQQQQQIADLCREALREKGEPSQCCFEIVGNSPKELGWDNPMYREFLPDSLKNK